MKKNIIISLIFISIFLIIFLIINKKENNINNNDNISNEVINNNDNNNKILVVYYSATGSTKKIAQEISNNLNAEIFEIEPKEIYTKSDLDWTNSSSRVSKEHNDISLRNIELKNVKVDDWNSYDTVIIGYPIWWGIAAWPVNNFIKDNDFTGKIVIPFCTSASSGLGNSDKLLKELAGTGNWQEGYRFSSNATNNEIKLFTDSIK